MIMVAVNLLWDHAHPSLQMGILSHKAFILGSGTRNCVMGGMHTNAVHIECLCYFSIEDLLVAYY